LQVEETDKVMEDIRRISEIYNQLALASSRIYFTLEQMSQIHFLYQFSLNYFLEVFYSVLQNNKNLTGLTDTTQRLEALTKDLFFSIFRRVSRFFSVLFVLLF
jgi:dynein heavy chain 1